MALWRGESREDMRRTLQACLSFYKPAGIAVASYSSAMPDRTPFAARHHEALKAARISQTEMAQRLSARYGRTVSPQTVQYLCSRAESSAMTPDVADITGFRYEYLARGELPKTGPSAKEPAGEYHAEPQPKCPYSSADAQTIELAASTLRNALEAPHPDERALLIARMVLRELS